MFIQVQEIPMGPFGGPTWINSEKVLYIDGFWGNEGGKPNSNIENYHIHLEGSNRTIKLDKQEGLRVLKILGIL